MNYLLDTNICICLIKQEPPQVKVRFDQIPSRVSRGTSSMARLVSSATTCMATIPLRCDQTFLSRLGGWPRLPHLVFAYPSADSPKHLPQFNLQARQQVGFQNLLVGEGTLADEKAVFVAEEAAHRPIGGIGQPIFYDARFFV